MPTVITWHDIALRLVLTVVAAGVIGFDRDERGRSAGLRTNLLVGLAACIAMIQTNLLIHSNGKPSDSFVVMDVMRLPLGILSGIGFIGAGAILKRGEMIVGLTTAATLWFVTVMGLCFGGGQTGLGLVSFGLAFVILSGLKKVEEEMPRAQTGKLRVNVAADGPDRMEIESLLAAGGISAESISMAYDTSPAGDREFGWKLQWNARGRVTEPPAVIGQLCERADVRRIEFTR